MANLKTASELYKFLVPNNNSSAAIEFIENHSDSLQMRDVAGNSLLHLAAQFGNLDLARFLVEEKKMDINKEKDYADYTPLHLAVLNNKDNVIEYLVQLTGADVNIVNYLGNSPLHYAALRCNAKILDLLISRGANVNFKDGSNEISLHIAARKCDLDAVKCLLDKDGSTVNAKNNQKETPLLLAFNLGNVNVVEYLVEHGADVHIKYDHDYTLLHLAAERGNLGVVKYLIKNGADINAQNFISDTPIHKAAESGSTDILRYFDEIGANLYATGWRENTALHYAAENGKLETVKYLIEEKKFHVEVKNKSNYTPLYTAVFHEKLNVIKYLIEEAKADINVSDDYYGGILHFAVISKRLDIVKYLVEEQSLDINVKDKNGNTPLSIAQKQEYGGIFQYFESRMQLRHRRSISSLEFSAIKPNLVQNIIASDLITVERGLSGNRKTIGHLSNSHQPLENSKFLFGVENFAFLGCIAEALNDSFTKRYNFLRSHGVNVVPNNQIAVNGAREEFDKFVENKIENLTADQKNEILEDLEVVGDEINDSLMRGVEFSGLYGLEHVLEMCRNCFCENLLPEKK